MAHRKSPRRIAKLARIGALHKAPPHVFTKLGLPRAALVRLEEKIVGRVVVPGMADYDASRQESNPAFQAFPQIIVYCVVPGDVEACLALSVNYGLWIAVRSGGHSTGGYSVNSGIVIDVSKFQNIAVDSAAMTVTVGPGIDFDVMNGMLDGYALHVPSGACGAVCVGGFMQGGGFGYTSRNYGINCDCVTDVGVMLWDGSMVHANASQNEDLFWAVRGGTGGNFGILLEVTYALQPLPSVWAFAIQWDISQAAAVFYELQQNYTVSGAPQALGYMMNVGHTAGSPVALIQGMYCGSAADGRQAVASLMAIPTAQLLVDQTGLYGAMDKYLDSHPYSLPDPPDGVKEDKITGYIAQPLSVAQWQTIVDQFLQSQSQWSVMYTESYGGAINAFPIDGNAFIHRTAVANLVIDAFWTDDAGRLAAEVWLADFTAVLEPFVSGEIYQNYPRRSYERFRENYWGVAFDTLLEVKQKYDPNNLFHYQQSISPWPEGMARKTPSEPRVPGFAKSAIVYERGPRKAQGV